MYYHQKRHSFAHQIAAGKGIRQIQLVSAEEQLHDSLDVEETGLFQIGAQTGQGRKGLS